MIPLNQARVELRARVVDFARGVELAGIVSGPDQNGRITQAIQTVFTQVVEVPESGNVPVLITLSDRQAQTLMTDLWNGGIRPEGFVATDKRVAALEEVVLALSKMAGMELRTPEEWAARRRRLDDMAAVELKAAAVTEAIQRGAAKAAQVYENVKRDMGVIDEYPPPLTEGERQALGRIGVHEPIHVDTSKMTEQLIIFNKLEGRQSSAREEKK